MMTTPEPPDRDERSARRAARRRERTSSPALRLPTTQPVLRWPALDWPDVAAQAEAVHQAALARLAEEGCVIDDADALRVFQSAGARVDRDAGRVWLTAAELVQHLGSAPGAFEWSGGQHDRSITLGSGHLAFAMHGQADHVLDPVHGTRTPTESDLIAGMKLGHVLGPVHAVGSLFSGIGGATRAETELQALGLALSLTDKPLVTSLLDRPTADGQLALLASVVDHEHATTTRLLGQARATEPGRWSSDVVQASVRFARSGQGVWIVPAPPRPGEADAWARQHADALSLAVLLQIAAPGTPIVLGGVMGGTPSVRRTLLGLHLARLIRLPAAVDATPMDIAPGAMAAAQSGWAQWPAVLGGCALLSSSGLVADGAAFSFEQLLIDAEALAAFGHFLGGFVVDDETLALDDIRAAGPGGHHLDTAHTRARYADSFFTPFLADRLAYETWEMAGSWDTATKARTLWPELLAAYDAPSLDGATRRALNDTLTRLGARPV